MQTTLQLRERFLRFREAYEGPQARAVEGASLRPPRRHRTLHKAAQQAVPLTSTNRPPLQKTNRPPLRQRRRAFCCLSNNSWNVRNGGAVKFTVHPHSAVALPDSLSVKSQNRHVTLMPRIKTDELLEKLSNGDFTAVKLRAVQNGSFILLLESAGGILIHENPDGSVKEYPKADHALTWLRRMTNVNEIVVDMALWA
jgi:hypothetical protein